MTNTETPAPSSIDAALVDGILADEIEVELAPEFVDTPATGSAELPVPIFRYLSWVHRDAARAFSVNLPAYSEARQVAVAALVDHGLVSERRFASGRVSYRLTEKGRAALESAWAAADLAVLGSI